MSPILIEDGSRRGCWEKRAGPQRRSGGKGPGPRGARYKVGTGIYKLGGLPLY